MDCSAISPYIRPVTGAIVKRPSDSFFSFRLLQPSSSPSRSRQPLPSLRVRSSSNMVQLPIGIGLGLHPVFVLGGTYLGCTGNHPSSLLRPVRYAGRIFRAGGTRFSCTVGREGKTIRAPFKIMVSTGLFPASSRIGFYVCPPVSWAACAWRRDYSILLTMGGYIAISLILILATLGFISASSSLTRNDFDRTC